MAGIISSDDVNAMFDAMESVSEEQKRYQRERYVRQIAGTPPYCPACGQDMDTPNPHCDHGETAMNRFNPETGTRIGHENRINTVIQTAGYCETLHIREEEHAPYTYENGYPEGERALVLTIGAIHNARLDREHAEELRAVLDTFLANT